MHVSLCAFFRQAKRRTASACDFYKKFCRLEWIWLGYHRWSMRCISIGKTLGRCIFSNTFKRKRQHYESDKSAFRFNIMSPIGVSIVQIYNLSWIFVLKFTLVEKVELTEIT